MVEKIEKINIPWHMKITWNSNFTAHKWSFTGTQPYSLVYVLSMAAFALQQQSSVVWQRLYCPWSLRSLLSAPRQKKLAILCLRASCQNQEARSVNRLGFKVVVSRSARGQYGTSLHTKVLSLSLGSFHDLTLVNGWSIYQSTRVF